jgi:S1-C subfamily serine protease
MKMPKAGIIISFFIAVVFVACPVFAGTRGVKDVNKAVVKIYTTSSSPNYYYPWRMGSSKNSTGSGSVIRGRRILTNAHMVADHTFIQVRSYGNPQRYNARVLYVSHESDLALLTVDDETFFKDIEPLELGELPATLQEVLLYGFPTGGDSLSITKGVLSRVEYLEYYHSGFYFLAGQIDAAVNPGNSGGPVIVGDRVVGVAMQKLISQKTENIGYMIPVPVIRHFLDDVADGEYAGFPELGFVTQAMENPGIRRKYGMKEDQTGTLVTHVFWNSSASGKIMEGDVLLEIEGHPIADDETVEFRPDERTTFAYYSDMLQVGDGIMFRVLRQGRVRDVEYALDQTSDDLHLLTSRLYDTMPRYFIFGGIVFTPLTKNLSCAWKKCKPPIEIQMEEFNWPTEKRREVVVAIKVLPADVNRGYHNMPAWVVRKVNAMEYGDFSEFYRLVTESEEPFVVFSDSKNKQVVIDRGVALRGHREILDIYHIKKDRSSDLK